MEIQARRPDAGERDRRLRWLAAGALGMLAMLGLVEGTLRLAPRAPEGGAQEPAATPLDSASHDLAFRRTPPADRIGVFSALTDWLATPRGVRGGDPERPRPAPPLFGGPPFLGREPGAAPVPQPEGARDLARRVFSRLAGAFVRTDSAASGGSAGWTFPRNNAGPSAPGLSSSVAAPGGGRAARAGTAALAGSRLQARGRTTVAGGTPAASGESRFLEASAGPPSAGGDRVASGAGPSYSGPEPPSYKDAPNQVDPHLAAIRVARPDESGPIKFQRSPCAEAGPCTDTGPDGRAYICIDVGAGYQWWATAPQPLCDEDINACKTATFATACGWGPARCYPGIEDQNGGRAWRFLSQGPPSPNPCP